MLLLLLLLFSGYVPRCFFQVSLSTNLLFASLLGSPWIVHQSPNIVPLPRQPLCIIDHSNLISTVVCSSIIRPGFEPKHCFLFLNPASYSSIYTSTKPSQTCVSVHNEKFVSGWTGLDCLGWPLEQWPFQLLQLEQAACHQGVLSSASSSLWVASWYNIAMGKVCTGWNPCTDMWLWLMEGRMGGWTTGSPAAGPTD